MIRLDKPAENRWAEHLGHFALRGPIVIVKTDYMGETRTLTQADVANLEMLLAQEPSQEARRAAVLEKTFWAQHPSGFVVMNMETGEWE